LASFEENVPVLGSSDADASAFFSGDVQANIVAAIIKGNSNFFIINSKFRIVGLSNISIILKLKTNSVLFLEK
jgi:hypothetical protein